MLFRTDVLRDFDRLAARAFEAEPGLPIDAYRHGDVFTLQFDLPGVDPGAIELTVERNELKIEVERTPTWPAGSQVLAHERPRGKFVRRLFLSDNLDTEHMTGDYEHGVLTVRLPMREHAKARKIPIGANDTAAIDVGMS